MNAVARPRMSGRKAHISADAAVPSLHVDQVTMRFGGVNALDDVSFEVLPGTIHALIGPNGAGKSTCFNVISGLYTATSGAVYFGEDEVTKLAPHSLAGRGIGRAFQNVALSGHVTVIDNVMLGRHSLTTGGFLRAGLRIRGMRAEQARHRARVEDICDFLGLSAVPRASGDRALLRRPEARRRGPCARDRAQAPDARRAGGRHERRGDRGDGATDPGRP